MKKPKVFLRVAGPVVLVMALGVLQSAGAQETPPPNSNPGERVVYPSQGQAVTQQQADMLKCHTWATENTTLDRSIQVDPEDLVKPPGLGNPIPLSLQVEGF